MATLGEPVATYPDYLSISIVNIGHREVQISNIGWKAGIFKKAYAVQLIPEPTICSPLPVRLKDGEDATYLVALNKEPNWLETFGKDMLKPFPKIQVHFIYVQVFTSVGINFEKRIEKGLRKKILEAIA